MEAYTTELLKYQHAVIVIYLHTETDMVVILCHVELGSTCTFRANCYSTHVMSTHTPCVSWAVLEYSRLELVVTLLEVSLVERSLMV